MALSASTSPFDRLKKYLPDDLAGKVSGSMHTDDARTICAQLSSLREVISTYLPRDLVLQIAEDPQTDLRRANFKQGAALFADVSGFTAMSEKLSVLGKEGAEEITSIVNDYFETMLEISDRYYGDLLKFGGDALLIFFEGLEGPNRALTVAVAMQETMSKYSQVKTSQGTFPLRMSIGIGSGEIFLTNLGSSKEMNYAVLGNALANMARAEDVATAGEIIVDRTTRDATQEIASFAPKGEDLWLFLSTLTSLAPLRKPKKVERSAALNSDTDVNEILQVCFSNLSFIEGLSPYVPEELLRRLIPDPSRPILYGSHRPVTVMFANFTGIDEIISAVGKKHLDEICAVMNTYFVCMSTIIAQYGGTISRVDNYVVGQRILALFGALRAHEDDPQRAIRAGLEMNQALVDVNRQVVDILKAIPDLEQDFGNDPIHQRIGVNSGFVFAGNMGSMDRREYTVMGDQVNLTARIMSVSEFGNVLIGQSTARQVELDFLLDERPPVKVKGKTDPVRTFVAQGPREKHAEKTQAALPPLVGREDELRQAQAAIEDALQGDGHLLVIRGPSGIGKTRLVEEIMTLGSSAGMDVLQGTCLSYGDTLTYHPWAEILRAYFDLQPSDEPKHRIHALEQGMDALGEVDWTPIIGTVVGLDIPDNELTRDLDAKLRRQRVLDLVVKFLQTRAQEKPLMLIVEDAHWADSASMDLINYVARNVAGHSVLLILPHRPDDHLPNWEEHTHSVSIDLDDLNQDGILGIVAEMIGPLTIPEATRELITEKASGNPFFAGEVVRALIDAGVFQQDESGTWRFVETEVAVELPDTIHGIVISRLDRLDATDRRILQTAAVVGRIFDHETVSGVYDSSHTSEGLQKRLDSLQNLGLVEALNHGGGEYRFIHLTTQEVVYESLAYGLRRNLHSQIGEFVEDTYADSLSERIGLLAYHFYQGHSWARALDYNLQAGSRAQTEFANDIAITAFEHALEASEGVGEELDTSSQKETANQSLGEVLTLVGRYEDALDHYGKARTLVKTNLGTDDRHRRLADLYRRTAEVYERQSEYDVAFQWLGEGLALLSEEPLSLETARIYLMGAGLYHRQAKNEDAVSWCQKALDATSHSQSRESQHVTAHTFYLQGAAQNRLGQLDKALDACKNSIRIYEQIDDFLGQARAYNNLSIVYSDMGVWGRAKEAAHKSMEINQRIGNIQEQGFVANNLGSILQYQGEWDRALELFQESNDIWKKVGAPLPDGVTQSNMAQIYILQGNMTQARERLEQAQAIFEGIGSQDFVPELERRWAEYHLKGGAPESALEHIHRSIELATDMEAQLELGMSQRVLGQINTALGDFESGRAALESSLEIMIELDSEYEAALTNLALARLELKLHGKAVVNKSLKQAIDSFEKLGAQADLKAAKELLSKQ